MNSIRIGDFKINDTNPSFIIAEAGVNHNGSLSIAKKLCDAAKKIGSNAIKFQTWKTEKIITKVVKTATYQKINTNEESQFDMLKKLELSFKDFEKIENYCRKIGLLFLSTPGDVASVDFLDDIGIEAFKIGSDDLDNLPLIKYVAQKNKPMIISTGMSTMKEIRETFDFVKRYNDKLIFLHCTSNYPTKIKDVNLNAMSTMKKNLGTIIGYSDHTTKIWVPIVAVCLGAKLIEKHLTISHDLPGPDHKASLETNDFNLMIMMIRKAEKKLKDKQLNPSQIPAFVSQMLLNTELSKEVKLSLGSSLKRPVKSEKEIMKVVRKTIVASRDIKKEALFSENNISIKRAGTIVIKPSEYFNLINKKAKMDIKKDEIISYEKCS